MASHPIIRSGPAQKAVAAVRPGLAGTGGHRPACPMPRTGRSDRTATLSSHTGCSAAWLARRVWVAEAAGSNPASPTKTWRARPAVSSRLRVGGQAFAAAQHPEQRPNGLGDRLSVSSSGSSGGRRQSPSPAAASLTARSARRQPPDAGRRHLRAAADGERGRGDRVHDLLQCDHRGPPGGRAAADRRRLGHRALELRAQVGQGPVGRPPHAATGPEARPAAAASTEITRQEPQVPRQRLFHVLAHVAPVCANCRGRCAYQAIGQGANPISSTIAQPISVSISRSSASRQPAGASRSMSTTTSGVRNVASSP